MLYLSGLKNGVADFLSCPPPPRCVATTPIDFDAMATEQNRCPEMQSLLAVHPSALLFAKQALSAWLGMSPRVFFAQCWRKNSEKTFFSPAQLFPPWEARLPAACFF
jgi:hypothetical protein